MSNKKNATPKPSPKNTLFNYFAKNAQKTPQTEENPTKEEKNETKILTGKHLDFGKRSTVEESSDDEQFVKPSKKRRILESDEEEDDVENTENNKQVKSATKRPASDFEAKLQAKIETPKAKVPKKAVAKEKNDEDDEPTSAIEKDSLMMVDSLNKIWAHETLDFLSPRQIRDKNKNRPNDPDYDPRTLHVPQEFLKQQTPAMERNTFLLTYGILLN